MITKRKRVARITWVTLGPEPYLATCKRCGRREPKPNLPMLLDTLPGYLESIALTHELCDETT